MGSWLGKWTRNFEFMTSNNTIAYEYMKMVWTYPQEKRHCTIARMPNLGPKTVLRMGKVGSEKKNFFLE